MASKLKADWAQIERSRRVLSDSLREPQPYTVTVAGREYLVLPGAFSPKYFGSTDIFTRAFPYRKNGSLLEIGCGAGITSVEAAIRGARRVLAIDISETAVENTRKNARLHGVSHLVEANVGDGLSNVPEGEVFDQVYWNLPFIYVPESFDFKDPEEACLFDPGYQVTEAFISGVQNHLSPGGDLLLGFGDFGAEDWLLGALGGYGFKVQELARGKSMEGGPVEFILFSARLTDRR